MKKKNEGEIYLLHLFDFLKKKRWRLCCSKSPRLEEKIHKTVFLKNIFILKNAYPFLSDPIWEGNNFCQK